MEKESFIVLTLSNPRDGGPWIMRVRHLPSVTDPRAAIAAAAKEYLRTRHGRRVAKSNGGDFNYGDVSTDLPERFLRRHGILEASILAGGAAWTDDHDRNFHREA